MSIKKIIAVASAKGGVGKSTITAALASHLSKSLKIGILDADIYGPNQHILFNVINSKPDITSIDSKKVFIPVMANNIKLSSMGFILDEDKAAVWRGPMLSGAIRQLMQSTLWGDLDILFIDMPPGTGDIALSLSQYLPRAEVLVVTTPQEAAQKVARLSAAMAVKVNLPVRGIIENMSWFTGDDGVRYELFGNVVNGNWCSHVQD